MWLSSDENGPRRAKFRYTLLPPSLQLVSLVLVLGIIAESRASAASSCSCRSTCEPTFRSFTPLSDAEAIARICPSLESKPTNAAANGYRPSRDELAAYLSARDHKGRTAVQNNPYAAYVTGACAAPSRSTDDLIQCVAAKWGIPPDWVRAQMTTESTWLQSAMGDKRYVGTATAILYPEQSRETDLAGAPTGYVWESLGIAQVKWRPDGSQGVGTEPLRWKSTAFSLDYYAATIRYYHDDPQDSRSSWGDNTYVPSEDWWSIAGYYEPYPWHNPQQETYMNAVKDNLAKRAWGALTPAPACKTFCPSDSAAAAGRCRIE